MIILFVFTLLPVAAGVGLMAAMLRRDEPPLGVVGLGLLVIAGIPGSVYGALASA